MRFPFAILWLVVVCPGVYAADASAEGKALFEKNCAVCHKAGAVGRTPLPDALAKLPKEKIIESLTSGTMRAQGVDLTPEQRAAIADFLTAGASIGSPSSETVK